MIRVLLALIVAIANSPLDIFQICAWNVGTLKTEPWRRKTRAGIVRSLTTLLARVRDWFGATGGVTGLPALTCLALVILAVQFVHPFHADGLVLMGIAGPGLKAARQRGADLQAEVAKLKRDKAAVPEKAVAQNRKMTDEERTAFLAFTPQIDALEAQITEHAEILAAAEAANEATRNFDASRVAVDPDTTAAAAAAGRAGLQVGESEEDKMAKSPSFMGMALHAVRRIATHEATAQDHKLVKIMAGPTGANTDVPSDGGFLIAPERSNTILERAYQVGEVAALVTRQPIGAGSNGIVLPAIDETSRADGSRYGGVASAWVGQGVTTTAGRPKFRAMELKLKKLLAFVYGTDELLVDAVAFAAFVNRVLPLELAFRVEDAIVNGDGSNKPIGILNSGAAVTVTRNTGSRILYEDVSAMWKRMWAPLRKTAVWLVDQSVEQELEQLSLAIGTGGVLAPIYKPAGISVGPDGTQGYSPATLYGRPILTTEYNAALGTVGDIILTNLSEYTLIDKGGVEQAVSMHVAFLTDESVFRFTYRADGQLNWNKALTPKNGGSTLSPVVTLT